MKGFIQLDYKGKLILINVHHIIAVRTNQKNNVVIVTSEIESINNNSSSRTYTLSDIYCYDEVVDMIDNAK